MFSKLLIANRGEIAIRVMQACAELGVRTVAVYSEADAHALHVRRADEALCIGPAPAAESYLNIAAIIAAALQTGAEAVHPGYGFLSENADFAQACADAGLVFVGPSPAAMRAMGSKIAAKQLAASLDVPLLPGYDGADQDDRVLAAEAARIGYPLLIKASAGGGGRGMRVVTDPGDFGEALSSARREALSAFGDDAMLLETYLERPRHVEIQVFGDSHGAVVYLGERECSIQRRHQKVIEEASSPALTPDLRAAMGEAAVRLARAIGYAGAGTVEFLLDERGRFAFLEMNTRLQVEHGVTELVTGLDLVHLQLRVAAGEPLPFGQDDVRIRGHAIQCRVYAEDPTAGFLPSTGTLTTFAPPQGAGIRNDIGVQAGDGVTSFYDPMLAKLLVVGIDRADAVERAAWALRRYEVTGVATNLPLLRATVNHPEFRAGRTFTSFLDAYVLPALAREQPPAAALVAAAVAALAAPAADPWQRGWRLSGGSQTVRLQYGDVTAAVVLRRVGPESWSAVVRPEESPVGVSRDGDGVRVERDGRGERIVVARLGEEIIAVVDGIDWRLRPLPPPDTAAAGRGGSGSAGAGHVHAPLTGTVVKIVVSEGEMVRARQPLVVIEAMKMEHTLTAPADAVVTRVAARPGDLVQAGAMLVELGDAAAGGC